MLAKIIITFDAKSAFLHGHFGLRDYFEDSNKSCRLKKSLYGLKQAPYQWFTRLTDFLMSEDFQQLRTDQCVFKTGKSNKNLYIAIHVDNGIMMDEEHTQIERILKKMSKIFEITINHQPDTHLGFQIKQTKEKYCEQVIKKYNMENANAMETTIASQDKNAT